MNGIHNYEYKLVGISKHEGSQNGGQYFAIIYNISDGCWYMCRDQSLYKISEVESVECNDVNMLVYLREGLDNINNFFTKEDYAKLSFLRQLEKM